MNYRENDIVKFFDLHPFGSKGWFIGTCPVCGAHDKFGIKFDSLYKGKKISSFNCFSGKCKAHGTVFKLLKDFNRLDLVDIKFVDIFKKLEAKKIVFEEDEDLDYSMKESEIPLGYKRIYGHPYLKSRGFDERFFKLHNIGTAFLDPKIGRDYVVFLLEEDNKCIGWLKRSIYTKEMIKKFEEKGKKILRWGNSIDTDFEKFIYGIEEVIQGITKTIIVVEGITSKENIDKLLNLYDQKDVKCVATFGKKFSKFQIKRLIDKQIENIILLYDPDAIKESGTYSMELEKYFPVMVGYIKNQDKDPGNLTMEELEYILSNLESPMSFKMNKLQKQSLI
jgi:DNA primase